MSNNGFFSPKVVSKGKARRIARDFSTKALDYIASLPQGEIASDVLRAKCERALGIKMTTPSIWGSIIKKVKDRGYIWDTGKRVKSVMKRGGGIREVPVYEVMGFEENEDA